MKKVKKVVLLMILMMILSLPVSSFAASGTASGNVTLTPSKTELESGEEFSIIISQECSDGIIGFEAKLEYDTNILELKKVNTLNDWIYLGESTKLDVMSNEDKKSGEVMQLDFAVKENVTTTTTPIKVTQIKLFKTYDNTLEVADQSVSIKVNGKEEINNDETTSALSKITITKIPSKIAYTEGESFDSNGMVITATYENGTSKEVTNYQYSPNSALKTSNNSITISYTENGTTKTTTQAISVKAASSNSNSTDNTNSNNNSNTNSNSNNSNNTTQNTNSSNTNNMAKTTTTDNTTTGTNLPKTGATSNIVLAIVGILIIIGFACYFGYRKYKEI